MTRHANRMQIFVLTFCTALAFTSLAEAQSPFEGQDEQKRDIVWLYESPLTVYEEVTDLGNGIFEYYYSFENVDEKHLWHFGVYTTFTIAYSPTTWDQYHGLWSNIFLNDLDEMEPAVYDARNLNPEIVAICSTFGAMTNPIEPGEYVQGFTVCASTFFNGPKLYIYETVEDGWAADTGVIAAIGYTQPKPVALEATAWGRVKTLYR